MGNGWELWGSLCHGKADSGYRNYMQAIVRKTPNTKDENPNSADTAQPEGETNNDRDVISLLNSVKFILHPNFWGKTECDSVNKLLDAAIAKLTPMS